MNATPAMTPHALQFHVVAVPFWGLQNPVPSAAASIDAIPTAAVTTTTSSAGAATARAAAGMATGDATTATATTAAEDVTPAKAGVTTAAEGMTAAVFCDVESQVAEQFIPTDARQAGTVAIPAGLAFRHQSQTLFL